MTIETTELELIQRYIVADAYGRGDDEVEVLPRHVAVWAIVGHYLGTGRHLDRVAADYDLPLEAVAAALAYYGRHQDVIDTRLAANLPPDCGSGQ